MSIKKPNVLFIFADDLRPELGCYGCEHVITPNIDRLASLGCHFEKSYVQVALCNPSRASMLTGKRPDELGVWGLDTHFRESSPDAVTRPQHFMAHGYHTASIGKIYHNDKHDPASWSEPRLVIDGYPETFNGNAILPIDGVSLTAAFDGKPLARETPLFIEHQGNTFVRDGDWKLVGRNVAPASGL